MKCLEKDRTRRYETANNLANDVERHLCNEPVVACPPTATYRVGKLLRKHRAVVAASAAFLCLLVAATFVSVWLAARATRERAAAVQAANAAAQAREESDRLRTLAETKAESEAKARELAQQAQAAEAAQRQQAADAWTAEKAQRQKADYEAYLAKVSLAAGKVENREIEAAVELLESCPKDLRHWEWGRLRHLCQMERRTFAGGSRLSAALIFPDAKRVLTANLGDLQPDGSSSASGLKLQVHDAESGACLSAFEHAGRYQSVLLSPAGRHVITTGHRFEGGAPGKMSLVTEAILWDTTTGKEIRQLPCDWLEPAHCASLSPDGRILALGGMKGQVKLFEVETARELADIAIFCGDEAENPSTNKADKRVWAMSFSPDGKFLLSAGELATQVWDVQTTREVHRISQRRRGQFTTLFSHDGSLVFFCDGTGSGQFWSTSSWQKRGEFQLGQTQIRCAAFSPDGRWLAAGTDNRGWTVVEATTGKVLVAMPEAHTGCVRSVAFANDGRRLLTAGDDRTAKLWELETEPGSALRAVERRAFTGHSGAVLSATFVPGEKQILTGSQDGSAKLWDCNAISDTVAFEDAGAATKLTAISPDGRYVLTHSIQQVAGKQPTRQFVSLWEARTGKRLTMLPEQPGFVASLGFTTDNRLAILRRRSVPLTNPLLPDRIVGLWNVAEGRWVDSCPALTNAWASVALSSDGKRLFTGSDKESCIWDIDSGRKIVVLTNALACLGNAAFSPDGRRIVARFGSAGNSKIAAAQKAAGLTPRDNFDFKVWDTASGAELTIYRGRPGRPSLSGLSMDGGPMVALTLLPDGRTALFQSSSAGYIWDLDSGRQIRRITAGISVFSPDFKRLCDNGAPLKVVDFGSGEVVSTPHGPIDRSRPSSFSPDGRRLWTSSADGMAQLWDADTGRELLTLKTGTGSEAKPMFSADGQNVLLIAYGRAQLLPAVDWK
jgi:WD40 repeat protein